MSLANTTCIWKLDAIPDVLPDAERVALEAMLENQFRDVPVPAPLVAHNNGQTIRGEGGNRSYYVPIPGCSGVIGIKGSEVTQTEIMREFSVQVARVRKYDYRLKDIANYREIRQLELYTLIEYRLPMAVTVAEALREGPAAADIVLAYARRYGEIPPVPLGLAVLRWPEAIQAQYAEFFRALNISDAAGYLGELMLRGDGLGCLIQYFPSLPLPRLSPAQPPGRFEALAHGKTPAAITKALETWVRTLVRILAVGYLPGSLEGFPGSAFQPQNAVVDGSVVDFDTAVRIDAIKDVDRFDRSYIYVLEQCTRILADMLFSECAANSKMRVHPYQLCFAWLIHLIRREIDIDVEKYGDNFHAWLKRLPPFADTLDSLIGVARETALAASPISGRKRGDLTALIRRRAQVLSDEELEEELGYLQELQRERAERK
jgi:hypothetical protein